MWSSFFFFSSYDTFLVCPSSNPTKQQTIQILRPNQGFFCEIIKGCFRSKQSGGVLFRKSLTYVLLGKQPWVVAFFAPHACLLMPRCESHKARWPNSVEFIARTIHPPQAPAHPCRHGKTLTYVGLQDLLSWLTYVQHLLHLLQAGVGQGPRDTRAKPAGERIRLRVRPRHRGDTSLFVFPECLAVQEWLRLAAWRTSKNYVLLNCSHEHPKWFACPVSKKKKFACS